METEDLQLGKQSVQRSERSTGNGQNQPLGLRREGASHIR